MPPFEEMKEQVEQYLTRKAQQDLDPEAAREGQDRAPRQAGRGGHGRPSRRSRNLRACRPGSRAAAIRDPRLRDVAAVSALRYAAAGMTGRAIAKLCLTLSHTARAVWPAHVPSRLPARAEDHPRAAADRRRAPRHRRGRHPLQGPHRRALRRASTRARRWPACSRARNARRRRSIGAARNLRGGTARALVVNSGNANAFTGHEGRAGGAAHRRDRRAGRRLRAGAGLPRLDRRHRRAAGRHEIRGRARRLRASAPPTPAWLDAATGDHDHRHLPEGRDAHGADSAASRSTINGIAKGAGMIAPDMATMLAFVFTDAPIMAPGPAAAAQARRRQSFNCVTVDGDTSTSDTLLLFATGTARERGAPIIDGPRTIRALAAFRRALDDLLVDLAQQVARDGEGARKFVTVEVDGATSARSAHRIALSIANSPLVKTGDRRRGRQLGPRRHGGRQGRRAGRPRQARDLVRRHPRRASRARATRPTTRRRPPPT